MASYNIDNDQIVHMNNHFILAVSKIMTEQTSPQQFYFILTQQLSRIEHVL